MKRLFARTLCLCVALLTGAAAAGTTGTVSPYGESISFEFDGRDWEIGEQRVSKELVLIMWALPGETVNKWTEQVTAQAFDKRRGHFPPPEAAMQMLKEAVVQLCPEVVWHVIELDDDSILFESRIEGCPPHADRHQITRIFEGRWNRFRVSYSAKVAELSPQVRAAWIKRFSDIKVVPRE